MVQRTAPTVLTAKNINGVIHSSSHGSVSWNSDGQCAFSHRRGVVILTPYITSTLPPPPKLVDPHEKLEHAITASNRIKRKAQEVEEADGDDDEGGDEDGDVPTSSVRRMRRPVGGEVQWWKTGFAVAPEGESDRWEAYGWEDTGDHINGMIGDKDGYVKKVVWSPSGLSELGGCVIAVWLASGQVSIYAPKSNPASNKWDEIADMTILTKELLPPQAKLPELSVRGMLEMRTTSLSWSDAVPLCAEYGDSGGILAMASRSGMVALWVLSAARRFVRIAYFQATMGWITDIAWSPWTITADAVYDGQIAMASTDGSVIIMAIRQQATGDLNDPWRYITGDLRQIVGDKRNITSLQWVKSLLVWSKVSTVHLWTEGGQDGYKWQGTRDLRLQRVGNWASANALGACVGIQAYGPDAILITLASLTRHLISDIHTSPRLGPPADSLRLSLAARECFIDGVYHDAFIRNTQIVTNWPEGKDVSAFVAGLGSLDDEWGLDSWTAEPIHYHNLSSSTEGQRSYAFMLVDRSGVLHDDSISLETRLERLLIRPPKVAETGPLRALLPYILRVLASNDPKSHSLDLRDVCAQDAKMTAMAIPGAQHNERTEMKTLVERLWDSDELNNLRLRYVLCLWAKKQFPRQALVFEQLAGDLGTRIDRSIRSAVIHWASSARSDLSSLSEQAFSKTQALFRSLADGMTSDQPEFTQLQAFTRQGDVDPSLDKDYCPACRSEVKSTSLGVAKCAKGHEWVRCCVTNMLITMSTYRACSVCPAVALMANRYKEPLRSVTTSGRDVDWERFNHVREEGDLTERLLEVAKVCLMCGGRWVRSM